MPPGKRLYTVLGVDQSATSSDVKKAYHRKALTCHPDKVGKAGEAEFKQLNDAYAVLSDAQKRKVYDDYGEKGLEYMNNGVADPLMSTLGTGAVMVFAAVFAFFTCFCAVAGLGCVAAKLDGHHPTWSWGTTLWALWMWETVVLIPIGIAGWAILKNIVRGPNASDDATAPSGPPPRKESLRHLAILLWGLLYFVFTVMIAATLDRQRDGKAHLKWIQVAVPLLIAEAARTVMELAAINPVPWLREQQIVEYSLWRIAVLGIARGWSALYRPLTVLLIALRADGSIHTEYGAALAPAMVNLCYAALTGVVVNQLRVRNGLMEGADLCKQTAMDIFNTLMLLVTLGLLGAKMQGSASYSYGVALIPLFIQLSYLTLISCVLIAVAGAMTAAQADELRGGGDEHDDADGTAEPEGDYTRLDSNATTPAANGARAAHDPEGNASPVSHTSGYGGIDASLD